MRIGVMGGTFDPIHTGHLIAAEAAKEACRLDRVLFVPAHEPPHKSAAVQASADARLRMVQAAVAGRPGFEASSIELNRGGKSYTIDTLTELKSIYPDAALFWIAGSDILSSFKTWRRHEDILRAAALIVARRPGEIDDGRAADGLPSAVRFIDIPGLDISSTEIRSRIGRAESVRFLVPDGVIRIIEDEKLYGAGGGAGR